MMNICIFCSCGAYIPGDYIDTKHIYRGLMTIIIWISALKKNHYVVGEVNYRNFTWFDM
jgi:hypothetical protein